VSNQHYLDGPRWFDRPVALAGLVVGPALDVTATVAKVVRRARPWWHLAAALVLELAGQPAGRFLARHARPLLAVAVVVLGVAALYRVVETDSANTVALGLLVAAFMAFDAWVVWRTPGEVEARRRSQPTGLTR
jgi:hypothetical protein